jgi:aminoglycoside phosphotransferase (APT) family kinase protein
MTVTDQASILEPLEAFLGSELGTGAPKIVNLSRASRGRSRENWLFDAVWNHGGAGDTEPLIVRRDPLGGLVETERATEFALLRALERSSVPAPRGRWLDATGAWLGRPSLIMRREAGSSDYYVLNGERALEDRVELAEQLCDLLAEVHRVDWAALGIGQIFDDPKPAAALRQLEEYEEILHRDQLEAYPELELAIDWLAARAPESATTVLVHGDFKPGNVLLEGTRVVALLDWEMAHLGDPLEDVGWVTQPLREREHLIPGAWERAQLVDRYRRASGLDVDPDGLRWWNVFSTFKTAVMQVSGLRSYLEGRCDEPYRPTTMVLTTLIDSIGG